MRHEYRVVPFGVSKLWAAQHRLCRPLPWCDLGGAFYAEEEAVAACHLHAENRARSFYLGRLPQVERNGKHW